MKRGFTLIELLVVISIIALLSSVVLASLNSARDKGKIAAGKQFAAQADHVAGDYAVALWDFDECTGSTTRDRSGSGIVGTFANATNWSSDTPFSVGCSLSLNGSNQHVSVPNINFDVNYTITAWIKTTMTGQGAVMDNVSCGGPACLGFGVNSGRAAVNYDFASTIVGNQSVNDGRWTMIAATFDGANTNIYVNGALDKTSTVQGARSASSRCGGIGTYYLCGAGGGNWFNGNIDSVHLFAKTLTAAEIQGIYAAESQKLKVAER